MLTTVDPLIHTTTWTRDSLGNKLTEKDALNNTTTFVNDSLGRITQQTDPNSKSISYTYDGNGNLLTVTDTTGTTTNTYEKENRITKVTLPDNTYTQYTYNSSGSLTSSVDALNNTTNYGYDNYQNLTTQQDALLHIKTNTFNALNQQTQMQTSLGKTTAWLFDDNGNISQRTDGLGSTTTYQYDSLNRLKKITYPNSTSITYSYDYRGNLTSMIDSSGTSTFTYDAYDRITSATNPFSQMIQYNYDNAGNITQLTYPDSKIVTYTYDNANRMLTAKDWNNQTTTYIYNTNGTLANRLLPNTITTTYSYDNANRLTTIEHKKGANTVAKFQYTRNLLGDIKIATESGTFFGTTYTNTFSYDNLRRLTGATYGYPSDTYSYTYDKVGNRLTNNHFATTNTYTYDADNRIAKTNGSPYTYNNNGNLISTPGFPYATNYTYNYENNLIKNQKGSSIDQYKYDGLGNRYELDPQSTQNIRFINDTSGNLSKVLEEYSLTFNSFDKWYLYGIGNIAEWDGYSTNTNADYNLEDGLGNTRFMTNYSGGMNSTLSYDPYGAQTYHSGGDPTHQYDGQRLDSDTNFYYLRARYYDPNTGRFITRDPLYGQLERPLTQNEYIYGFSNPINNDDPSGKNGLQILQNQLQGISFEKTVLSLYGETKNTYNLTGFGLGKYIPDILRGNQIGEIKSGSYLYLSSQLRAFIQYAKSIPGGQFRLFLREGARMSGPLEEALQEAKGVIIIIP